MYKLKLLFAHLPKPVRFAIKCAGVLLAVCTSPVWFPALIVLWAVLRMLLGILDFYDKA